MQLRQQESIRKENLGTTICHFIVFAHVNFCGVVSGPPCDQGPPGPLSQHECGSSLWDPRLAKLGRFLPVTFLGCPEPLFHAAHAPQGLSAVVLGFFEKEKKNVRRKICCSLFLITNPVVRTNEIVSPVGLPSFLYLLLPTVCSQTLHSANWPFASFLHWYRDLIVIDLSVLFVY